MMLRQPALRFAVLAMLPAAACAPDQPTEWVDAGAYRWRDLAVPTRGGPGFTAMGPRRTGVSFSNALSREAAMQHDHLLIGSGVTLGDYDGDGLTDIYFSRLQGDNALYRNRGDWSFEEVTRAAGVAAPDRYATGAVFADLDGDGWLDLFVTALGGPNALYRNLGDGGFEEITDDAGLASRLGSTSAAFADVDGDGDLDLYLATYKVQSAADVLRPYEQPSVELVVDGPDGPEIAPGYRDHFRIEERGGSLIAVEQADPDRLYLNDGTGRFEPVPWTGGRFLDASGAPLERDLDDFALAAAFHDVDGDGDPDLYVCNDFDDPDQLWINDGSGTFRAADPLALRTTSHAAMAVDFSDIDRDGVTDFFVADMLSADPGRRLAQVPLHAEIPKPIGREDERLQVGRNTLFHGRGDGTWAQIAEMAGVDGSEWTWGSLFLDVDLDGFEDLLTVNGHGRDMRDGDAFQRVTGLRGAVTWNEAKSLYPDLPTRNLAFRNNGDLTFTEAGEAWGFGDEPDVSHGIALGDLDGDGDLDVVVNRLNQPPALLRNDATGARVAVRLSGRAPNTGGVGARVRLLGGAVPVQEKEMRAGGLYLSGSQAQVAFAAGDEPMALEVVWASGAVSHFAAAADRVYDIAEPAVGGSGAVDAGLDRPAPLFVAQPLPGFEHADRPFEDLARQPLLPYQLSRLGPGVTWSDFDGDGDPDLTFSAGQGGVQMRARNSSDGFRVLAAGGAVDHDRTTLLPAYADRPDLLHAGQTSYDAGTPDAARDLPGVVLLGLDAGGRTPVAAPHLSSVGPLAQADVDGDGDLDIFVGGRTVPAFYPLPATSRILLNDGVGFVEPAEDDPHAFGDIGMVSGAVFSDLDGDGDPDLVLAVEWGPLLVLENEAGAFRDASEAWGLGGLTGLWRGVTTGDLNGDGLLDLVATNQGRNTRLATSPGRPLTLVHADVDRNGSWDLVPARARVDGGPLHPLARLEVLRAAVPSVRGRIADFAAYSRATVAEALGVDAASLFQLRVATLEHTLFLNRGGRFDAVVLPVAAQLAPAHHVGIADVDGDGNEDVFITQNFFPTEGFTPRYDAGRGLVLLGDGGGSLRPLAGAESGVIAYGDQRGAAFADYDADGRIDLAVGQHGSRTLLFRNVGAEPGLRVRLVGPPRNPAGIGAVMRLLYVDGEGPVREIHSGAGYWSVDDPVQVLGLGGEPRALRVVWPAGAVAEVPLEPGQTEVVVEWSPG